MIVLLARTIYSGDSIKKLFPRSQCGPKPVQDLISTLAQNIHEYFVFGIKANVELADLIREYNICKVSFSDKFIVISGNTHDIILLVSKLSQSDEQNEKLLAEYFTSSFPEIFKDIPRASTGALMLWKPKY